MIHKFDKGDLVRCSITYRVDGVGVDPGSVVFKYQDPSGNETTVTYGVGAIVRSAVGVYYFDIDLDESGLWYIRWASTGAYQSAVEDGFYVRSSQF